MAVVLILAGGVLGFASAFAALILFDASLPLALAIWSGTGLAVLCLGLSLPLLPRRTARAQTGVQTRVRTGTGDDQIGTGAPPV